MASTISASLVKAPVATTQRSVLKPAGKTFKAVTVSNGNVQKTSAMMVWTPVNNKFFETFSYLPPLSGDQIARQVDYIVLNGWTPCLEFADPDCAYVSNDSCVRFGNVSVGYQDNRYWTMWKLPMFGCTDPSQVLKEISNCERAFPDAYIRLVAFDAIRQVQITGFLVHRPMSATEHRRPNERSV
uniref:Ribulose bisphosphate carboxylase small subunit, chloroplastic n=1 Tax=Auxenochlorella pyrenoidosa TaxID=3078 RepID=C7FF11_AUXPY|nr:chloroplast ribulose-1,5-bisphosphate carboxylase/oxygenase small subunit [Auxenochlorella pyrenoidosa]